MSALKLFNLTIYFTRDSNQNVWVLSLHNLVNLADLKIDRMIEPYKRGFKINVF
jgi:hypothetical protein